MKNKVNFKAFFPFGLALTMVSASLAATDAVMKNTWNPFEFSFVGKTFAAIALAQVGVALCVLVIVPACRWVVSLVDNQPGE